MSFCEHCEGQRFDRAQILRVLRATRKNLPKHSRAHEALGMAIKAVSALEIPHLERLDEPFDEQIVH
jgi:imidazolonepropionase-like amidohydrolase